MLIFKNFPFSVMEPKSPWSTWSTSTAATCDTTGTGYVATEKADLTDTSDVENENGPQRPAAAGDFGFKVRSDTWILNLDPEDFDMETQQPGADTGLKVLSDTGIPNLDPEDFDMEPTSQGADFGLKVLTASHPEAKKKRTMHDPRSEVVSVGKMMRVKTMRGEGPDFYKASETNGNLFSIGHPTVNPILFQSDATCKANLVATPNLVSIERPTRAVL